MKRKLLILMLLSLPMISTGLKAQIFAGGSYVYAQISESGLDQVTGFSFDIQGEFKLPREKLSLLPTIRLAILDSRIYDPANPFYIKSLSFSPLLAYKLIEFKGFSLSPYGGPFVSKLQGRRAPSFAFPAGFINDNRVGVEFGIEFRLRVYDYCILKFNPINLIIGNEDYRQGNVNVMLNF